MVGKEKLADKSIGSFLAETARSSPTPGGGAVSAVAGALAAALVAMVCGLTVGKERYWSSQSEARKLQRKVKRISQSLLELADEDIKAFDLVVRELKKGEDSYGLQEALKRATLVPLRVFRLSAEVLAGAERVCKIGNRSALTDAKTAVELSKAAVRGAVFNVKVNLRQISDEAFKTEVLRDLSKVIL